LGGTRSLSAYMATTAHQSAKLHATLTAGPASEHPRWVACSRWAAVPPLPSGYHRRPQYLMACSVTRAPPAEQVWTARTPLQGCPGRVPEATFRLRFGGLQLNTCVVGAGLSCCVVLAGPRLPHFWTPCPALRAPPRYSRRAPGHHAGTALAEAGWGGQCGSAGCLHATFGRLVMQLCRYSVVGNTHAQDKLELLALAGYPQCRQYHADTRPGSTGCLMHTVAALAIWLHRPGGCRAQCVFDFSARFSRLERAWACSSGCMPLDTTYSLSGERLMLAGQYRYRTELKRSFWDHLISDRMKAKKLHWLCNGASPLPAALAAPAASCQRPFEGSRAVSRSATSSIPGRLVWSACRQASTSACG